MLLTRTVPPGLLARGDGVVLLVSSMSGKLPLPAEAPCAAAKAGTVAFAHALRRELDGTGVHVGVLAPGNVADVGQAARALAGTSVAVPASASSVTVGQVVDAALGATAHRRAEVAVQPGPSRLLSAFQAAAPTLVDRVLRRTGIDRFWLAVADEHAQRADHPEAATLEERR